MCLLVTTFLEEPCFFGETGFLETGFLETGFLEESSFSALNYFQMILIMTENAYKSNKS